MKKEIPSPTFHSTRAREVFVKRDLIYNQALDDLLLRLEKGK